MGVVIGVVVLNTLLDACCRCGDLASAGQLLDDMASLDIAPDLITYSTLIKGYCQKGDLDKALELFGAMRRRGIRADAIVFNSLLDGCARKELPKLCEQVINDMIAAGLRPSSYSASILIKLYGRTSDLDAAFKASGIFIHAIHKCIYMFSCSVLTSPPWYGPPRPWATAHRPTIRLCKAACLPYLPLFPHLVKFLANTMQFNTTCKDYDSIKS